MRIIRIRLPWRSKLRNVGADIQTFFEGMILKLHKNEHKMTNGGWGNGGRSMNPNRLYDRLEDEVDELREAMQEGSPEDVFYEACDVANFALLIATMAKKDRVEDEHVEKE